VSATAAGRTRGPGRTRERLREVSVEHEIPFHDVDALQIVWHGHYFKYFELARTALLRSCGLDAHELVGTPYRFVVIDARCRHVFPLRYGERARISAWFRDFSRRIMIGYELENLTHGRRSARGYTALATLDGSGNLLLNTPSEIAERIRS